MWVGGNPARGWLLVGLLAASSNPEGRLVTPAVTPRGKFIGGDSLTGGHGGRQQLSAIRFQSAQCFVRRLFKLGVFLVGERTNAASQTGLWDSTHLKRKCQ